MFRRLHEVMMITLRLATAGNLAMSLSKQGKHADAERIQREVLGLQKRLLGPRIRTLGRTACSA